MLLILAAQAVALAISLIAALPGSSAPAPQRVAVSVGETAVGRPVSLSFLGLSYEVRDLPLVASLGERGNLAALLRSLGTGVLRFGGVTADSQVAWRDPPTAPLPAWAHRTLVPADLYRLANLARATRWSVVLTLNLAHYDPGAAADEARIARRALGASLRAIEIGNEPSAFFSEHLRHAPYSIPDYRREIERYRAAVEAAVPHLPIAGPDNEPPAAGSRNLVWMQAEARKIRPTLLTGHLYGATNCTRVRPTASLLLSGRVHRGEARALRALEGASRSYRIPVWLDETNNISCGGTLGVSDTYAAALWALDLLTRTLTAPFVGDAFHGFPQSPSSYSPLAALSPEGLSSGALTARPEWYALLLAHEVEGDRPLSVWLRPRNLNVAAWAGRTSRGALHVIIDNERQPGSRPLLIELPDRTRARLATVLRLQAPALNSSTGVTLGGASVAGGGSWNPTQALPRSEASDGAFRVLLAPASAVLITTEAHIKRKASAG